MALKQKGFTFTSGTGGTQQELRASERIRSILLNNRGSNNVTVFFGDKAEPNGIVLPPSTSINLTVFDLYAENMIVVRFTGTSGDTIDAIWIEGTSGLDAFLLALQGRR